MTPRSIIDRLTGILLVVTTLLVILTEWRGAAIFSHVATVLVILLLILLTAHVGWTRQIFVVIGVALLFAAVLTRADWEEIAQAAFRSAAFIAAFFTAMASLRNASATSPAIQTCGRFLAEQPPGRRYAALTAGGHLFGLLLTYGAIVLLGGLAESNAVHEPNHEIRGHRLRRMLLAVQRGFVSTLAWSPLAFAMAISSTLVPGASWGDAAGPGFVSALILAGLGWALDTMFKPRLSTPAPPRAKPPGSWASLWPLLALLGVLVLIIGGLHLVTGIRAVGVVMPVVPALSIAWIAVQNIGRAPLTRAATRAVEYATRDLPGYRSELVLLMMAGFIGTLGGRLLSPLVAASGIDLSTLPGWQILVALIWLIPLTGQIGMNPILSVSLIAPILPDAAAMGVTPTAVLVALTAGWALSGASSPYTATTLLIGAIGKVSAVHVGLRWNGVYTLVAGIALSLWVALFASL